MSQPCPVPAQRGNHERGLGLIVEVDPECGRGRYEFDNGED